MADEEVKKDETTSEEEVKEETTEAVEEKVQEAPKAEEKTAEEPKKEEPKKDVEVPKKFKDLVKTIEEMSVLEMSELVKVLEEKFGVSAAAPVAVAAGPAAAGGAPAEEAEEKSAYTVVLTAAGSNKIGAIKAVREINQTLGLKEAKDLVDGAPKTVAENLKPEEANAAKEKLEAAGATVELK